MEAGTLSPKELTVIKPRPGWMPLDLAVLWRSRELIGFFIWREINVRYKQTLFGAGWAILQPFLAMVVFTIFFGRLANIESDGVPYELFAFSGLLAWTFFAYSINIGSQSLVNNHNLITKVYFPRLSLPLGAVLSGTLDFLVASGFLVIMLVVFSFTPPLQILLLPLFFVMLVGAALGLVIWLSSLAVEFRDVRYVVPFLLQFWIFVTPVAYPVSLVPSEYQWLLGLNPMAGVVDGFRWSVLGTAADPAVIGLSIAVIAVGLLTGLYYFRRVEDTFADRI